MDTLEKITYPFTPERLDELPEKAVKKCWDFEDELLMLICAYFAFGEHFEEISVDDLKGLKETVAISEDVSETTAKGMKSVSEELETVLNDAVSENTDYYEQMIKLAEVETPESLTDMAEIQNISDDARGQIEHATENLGFSVDNGKTKVTVENAYSWAINNAITAVESGEVNARTAITNAVRQLAESGVRVIEHDSGYTEQLDVYVRKAVMTAVNRISQKYAESSMDYLGTDLVEVSAHIGARNKGGIPENHELWQGQCYQWTKADVEAIR